MESSNNEKIKKKWSQTISEGKKVSVKWDAGFDETPVWVYINEIEAPWQECEDLVDLIIESLNLPNAGEYGVKGKGSLLVKDGQLLIEHSSKHEGFDYIEPPEDADYDDLVNYDWEANTIEVDKTVSETIILIS